jgi:antitoxin MazE
MPSQIAKWGHSLAVRIPKSVAERARLKAGDAVALSARDGRVVIARRAREQRLDEIVKRITPDNLPERIDWGPPVGREVW